MSAPMPRLAPATSATFPESDPSWATVGLLSMLAGRACPRASIALGRSRRKTWPRRLATGTRLVPDFDHAVRRHQMLASILAAARSSWPGALRHTGDIDATDDIVEQILRTYDTITVVGLSADPAKAAFAVPRLMQRHGWRIIPVNPHADQILGEPVYRSLAEVPGPIGLVDVFRPPAETPDVARQAVAAGASALWLQLGIASVQAREIAVAAGLLYVENRCLAIEQRRLGLDAPAPGAPR